MHKKSKDFGFTLIEVMIVLSILAAATAFFLTRIDNTNNQLKESVRQLGVLSRDIRYRARLRNATYRLVIDMHSGESSEEPHEYWVEQGSGPILFTGESSHSPYDREAKSENQSDKDEGPPPDFAIDKSLTPKKRTLPSGLVFEDVEIASVKDKIAEGTVYIHYLPQGLVDESVIHIKYNDDIRWTIAIHPLTGKAEFSNKYIELKEILDR